MANKRSQFTTRQSPPWIPSHLRTTDDPPLQPPLATTASRPISSPLLPPTMVPYPCTPRLSPPLSSILLDPWIKREWSTISEVERPTPYENHPLPQELKGATPVSFQPKYENVGAAKSSRSGSIHFDVYENVLSNERANERIYENLQQTMSPDVLHIDRDYTM